MQQVGLAPNLAVTVAGSLGNVGRISVRSIPSGAYKPAKRCASDSDKLKRFHGLRADGLFCMVRVQHMFRHTSFVLEANIQKFAG